MDYCCLYIHLRRGQSKQQYFKAFLMCILLSVFERLSSNFNIFILIRRRHFSLSWGKLSFPSLQILPVSIGQWVIILAACILFYLMGFFLFQYKSISHIIFCCWFVLLCHQLSHHLWLLIPSSQSAAEEREARLSPHMLVQKKQLFLILP